MKSYKRSRQPPYTRQSTTYIIVIEVRWETNGYIINIQFRSGYKNPLPLKMLCNTLAKYTANICKNPQIQKQRQKY